MALNPAPSVRLGMPDGDLIRQLQEHFTSLEEFPTTDWLPERKTGWMRHVRQRLWFFQVHDFECGADGIRVVLDCRGPYLSRKPISDPETACPYGFYVSGTTPAEVMAKFLLISVTFTCK